MTTKRDATRAPVGGKMAGNLAKIAFSGETRFVDITISRFCEMAGNAVDNPENKGIALDHVCRFGLPLFEANDPGTRRLTDVCVAIAEENWDRCRELATPESFFVLKRDTLTVMGARTMEFSAEMMNAWFYHVERTATKKNVIVFHVDPGAFFDKNESDKQVHRVRIASISAEREIGTHVVCFPVFGGGSWKLWIYWPRWNQTKLVVDSASVGDPSSIDVQAQRVKDHAGTFSSGVGDNSYEFKDTISKVNHGWGSWVGVMTAVMELVETGKLKKTNDTPEQLATFVNERIAAISDDRHYGSPW